MENAEWAEMAEWYDLKQGDTGDLWHRGIIDPGLLEVLGPVRGLDLLDLACGNGYLARRFAREGARVTALDASAPIVARAQARETAEPLGIRYLHGDATHLTDLSDASFDVAVCNMALMDIDDAAAAIREVGRVVRPGGRFVFSLCHPCFDLDSRSAWEVEYRRLESAVWRKVTRYRELHSERVPWRKADGSYWFTTAFHRPLPWYVRALAAGGFSIEQFEEPSPTEEVVREHPHGRWIAEIPLHCVVGARRRGTTAP